MWMILIGPTIMQSLVWFILHDNTQKVQSNVSSKKAVKLMWDKADLDLYRSVLQLQLSRITIPTDALLCDHCML